MSFHYDFDDFRAEVLSKIPDELDAESRMSWSWENYLRDLYEEQVKDEVESYVIDDLAEQAAEEIYEDIVGDSGYDGMDIESARCLEWALSKALSRDD